MARMRAASVVTAAVTQAREERRVVALDEPDEGVLGIDREGLLHERERDDLGVGERHSGVTGLQADAVGAKADEAFSPAGRRRYWRLCDL